MTFSDITFDQLESQFGVENRTGQLFERLPPSEPSERLKESLAIARELPIRSEKARSELIVMPILLDARARSNKFFTIYAGDILTADESRGLKGECDYILAKDTGSFSVNYPIIQVVEAKKNDMDEGIRQCAAQLVGARVFNEKKGIKLDHLYGCATTGDDWQFVRLDQHLTIDNRKYYLVEVGELLSVFQHIMQYYQKILA